jgi:glycosyltransferase involved in cell wall biosynthesis
MILGIYNHMKYLHKEWKFDIIHAHTIFPDGLVAYFFSKILNVPLICTAHGSDININPNESKIIFYLTKYTIKKIKYIISVSNDLKNKIFTILGSSKPIIIIRNGADENLFSPKNKFECREKLKLPNNSQIILFVGNLIKIKGANQLPYILYNVVKRKRDVILCIIGKGKLMGYIRAEAIKLNIMDNIILAGYKPHWELCDWINAADVAIIPSISEGFPTIIPEILLCGKPIVAYGIGGIPEVLIDDIGCLVEPWNIEDMSNKIIEALSKYWDSDKIISKGKELTWSQNAKKTKEYYDFVLLS